MELESTATFNLFGPKVQMLIEKLGFFDLAHSPHFPPHLLFREMGIDIFRSNLQGPAVESVRLILNRIESQAPINFDELEGLVYL